MAITNPTKYVSVRRLQRFETKIAAKYQAKAIDLTGIDANTVEDALVELKNKITSEISAVYKPAGNKAAAELVAGLLVEGNLGKVFNLTNDATTDSNWLEDAGKTVEAGTDVGVVAVDIYVATEDQTAQEGKTYYADANGTALDNQPEAGADISAAGYFEKSVGYKFNAFGKKVDLSNYKTKQTAVVDPSAGNTPGLEFIASITQNANGEIEVTKESVQEAEAYVNAQDPGKDGLLSAEDKAKIDGLLECSDEDIDSIFA